MNDRQRFLATMHYQPRDRCPMYDFSFWDETLPLWHGQALPENINRSNASAWFGMDKSIGSGEPEPAPVRGVSGLVPGFESKVIEDRGDYELVQQGDGVRVVRKKHMGTIPTHDSHLLVDRASWREHYLPKLNPDYPNRFPEGWDEHAHIWRDANREHTVFLGGCSLYGWIRNWMGMENVSLVVYDDPAWFEEMVDAITDCAISSLEKIFRTRGQFDGFGFWEDMCYNTGPLLSPQHFKQFLVPRYRRITDLLTKHGVDVIWVDCDGCIDALLPLWLDAGVNCMFPIEIGTWNADPRKFRGQFGKELLMMGGFGKHILAQSKQAITDEIHRLTPLVDEGGYIPFADHRVPPDVPYANYLHYIETARHVWCRDKNLRPVQYEHAEANR